MRYIQPHSPVCVCGGGGLLDYKGLVINYGEGGGGGGATKWENHGSETFCAPPQDSVKLSTPPPF